MKNEVRPIDANALARKIREYMDNFPYAGTRLATCRVVLSMLGDEGQTPTVKCDQNATEMRPDFNKPLTLEQLREMDGRPVRMEDLTGGTLWNQWIIFERHTDDGFIPRGGGYFGCDSYGVKWLAYAYPPAHIDREAWTAEWIKYDGYTECSKCKHWYDSPESEDDGDRPAFCPSCGRAMTPEAWAELEKRMGVVR